MHMDGQIDQSFALEKDILTFKIIKTKKSLAPYN